MALEFKPGQPTKLTEEESARILSFVPGAMVMGQVARKAGITRQTLTNYLKRGESDSSEGLSTIYTQFFAQYHAYMSEEIDELLTSVKEAANNWQAPWKLLTKVAKDDFGDESADLADLKAQVEETNNAVKRLAESKGV